MTSPSPAIREFDVKIASVCLAVTGLFGVFAVPALGQAPSSASPPASVSRTTKAVNYRRAGSLTRVDFQGTELMSGANGEARVQSKSNRIEIEAKFLGLDEATKFGLEYLTYVLWAVSPGGRAVNLGEVVLKTGGAQVKAIITDMQSFGMIVTAEPYFAVTQPGNTVVLENVFGPATLGKVENIDASYTLLGRGNYSSSNTKIENAIFGIDRKTPLEVFEARNAVRIAHIALADKYAPSMVAKAEHQLRALEEAYSQRRDRKSAEASAERMKQQAEKAAQEAARQKQEADQARAAALAQQQAAQAEAEQASKDRAAAQADAAQASRDRAAAQADAEKARQAAAQAEAEKGQLRAQLLAQLNSILQTRDSARGLIVNMSDVLFDTGSYTLKPGAREKLAKISGIVLAHPGLMLQIEGHTDSVGGDEFNQQLSERRAGSVREFLAEQGVSASSITARGFGKTQPVASNETAEGRQRNRRVELVVNGNDTGNTATASAAPGSHQ